MNFIFALLVLLVLPREPQIFYYNGKALTQLSIIQMPNVGHAAIKLLVNSPYELRSASVDSTEVQMCLPEYALTKELKLKGRWYRLTWEMGLTVGSMRHTLYLTSYCGRIYKKNFTVNVEGTKRLYKPQGVNR